MPATPTTEQPTTEQSAPAASGQAGHATPIPDQPGRLRGFFTPRQVSELESRVLAAGAAAQLQWELAVDRTIKARRLPYALAVVTGGIGTLAWAIGYSSVNPLIVAPTAAAFVLGATAVVQVAKREIIHAAWRRRVWQVGTVSALWVALNALMPHPGLVLVMVGTLFVLQHVLSRRWRADHPLPIDATINAITTAVGELEPASEAEVIDDDVVQRYARAWETNISASRGALPDSSLTAGEATEHAVRYTLNLVPGRQSLAGVKSKITEISSGLGPDPDDLIVEPHPRAEGELKDSSRLRLTIVLRSPVEQARFYAGPRLSMDAAGSKCQAIVGRFADGVGEAEWTFWNAGGMRNGVIIGSTRSGKSGLSVGLAVSARATGRLNTIYVDPQGGMSSPGIAQNATVGIYGREAARRAIDVVEAIAQAREARGGINRKAKSRKEMFATATSKFMPEPHEPGWVVFVDECDKIFSDPAQATAWSEFVSRCLKLGMCVVAITQYPGLTSFGLESLRSNLALNYIALKTNSKSSRDLIPGLTKDPAELPSGMPGYGLFGGGDRADVPFRGDWLPESDDADKLPTEPPWRLEAAMEAHTEPPVCEQDRAVLEGLLGQADEDGFWTVVGNESFLDDEGGSVPTRSIAAASTGGPDFSNVASLPPVPDPLTVEPVHLEESDRQVLDAVTAGVSRPKDLQIHTGLSRAQVHRCLAKLGANEMIRNPRQGVWKLCDGTEHDQVS